MNHLLRGGRLSTWLTASMFAFALVACGGGGEKIPDLSGGGGGGGGSACTDPSPSTTSAVAFAPAAASGPTLSANSTSACFNQATVFAVRSTTAIAPGASSIHYFEATRTGSAAIGIGTDAAPMVGNTAGAIPANTVSLIARDSCVSLGGDTAGRCGNIGTESVLGFAVDYRGAHPIVFVFGRKANTTANPVTCASIDSNQPCVLDRYELSAVTTPVYIYAFGNNSFGVAKVSINGGARPYTYGVMPMRKALRSRWYGGDAGFNPQWVSGAGNATTLPLPVVTRGSPEKTVILAGDATPFRNALSATASDSSGSLTTSMQWLAPSGTVLGTGGTLNLVNNAAVTALAPGSYRIDAVATNSAGMTSAAGFTLVVAANAADDDDEDGLTYAQEKAANTDPANPDTDGDGLADGAEAAYGLNPRVADNIAGTRATLVKEAPTIANRALLSEDGLSVAYTFDSNPGCLADATVDPDPVAREIRCRKRAVRANVGIAPGEFRYFETKRLLVNAVLPNGQPIPQNEGQGLFDSSPAALLDPYCCLAGPGNPPNARTPQSMSLNSEGEAFYRLSARYGFDGPSTQYIGFVVDYTDGVNVRVYSLTTDQGANLVVGGPIAMPNFVGPARPFVYGDFISDSALTTEVNFGLKQFFYDSGVRNLRSALVARGVNVTGLTLGVGIHRRPLRP